MGLQPLLDDLLAETSASRVTLREDVPGETFPVTCEALAFGVSSLRGVETPNMAGQPVVLEVKAGRQVVQNDSALLFPEDRQFHEMRALYGGLKAQIVTPVVIDGRVPAIVSVHELGRTRQWSADEAAACRQAAERVAEVLGSR